ncbi:hypothetical protein AMTR_s00013p00226850 [Amborella trichopoda]|uniref:Uncharacterized protein n=1 Tax=Amborella trichopoda TaxID=13333 RepID=W1PRW2_AMBTC|nr:hypothetical protein AMTR_s00013p00226850 [Amborella trichopoda]
MSEEDRLFNFVFGLQSWAQAELRRQGVWDLPTAMAAAEGLTDLNLHRVVESNREGGPSRANGEKMARDRCGGNHRVRDCLQKQTLNAVNLVQEDEGTQVQLGSLNLMNAMQLSSTKEQDWEETKLCVRVEELDSEESSDDSSGAIKRAPSVVRVG